MRLAVISNGPPLLQREVLGVTGLAQWFDVVVPAGELGIRKPDPRIFQVALTELGASPDNAWHVGDSLGDDVAGAHAAGIHAVWINRSGPTTDLDLGDGSPVPDRMITSLRGLTLRPAQAASCRDDGNDSREADQHD